jgi:hypothetical protein
MSSYSPSLRIQLITTGDQAGVWGTTTNTNLGTLIESAIAGYTSVSITSTNQALTALDGIADQSRNQTIALTTSLAVTSAFNVYAPPAEKTYVIYNASPYAATIYNSTALNGTTPAPGGTTVTIPAGKTMTVWSDGTNFAFQNTQLVGDVTGNATSATSASSANSLATTNWTASETVATQVATLTIASPAVVTVATAPANNTAVSFSTTGALPTGVTTNAAYYVVDRTSTTYKLATSTGTSQTADITIATPGVITVSSAPANNNLVVFSTTGALPTGLTAGTGYYVVNRTATTFEVSATYGGSAIATTGTQSGSQTATWYTLVNTSGTQSGVQTETISKLYFKYRTLDRMSIDLGGNLIVTGNITAYGTP